MKIKHCFRNCLLAAWWFIGQFAMGQQDAYREFDNVYLNSDASVINCFIQDRQGLIWMGSDKGLFSYNGYSVQRHIFPFTVSKNPSDTKINCGILLDSGHLCLGFDNGILIYNLITDGVLIAKRSGSRTLVDFESVKKYYASLPLKTVSASIPNAPQCIGAAPARRRTVRSAART